MCLLISTFTAISKLWIATIRKAIDASAKYVLLITLHAHQEVAVIDTARKIVECICVLWQIYLV